MRDYFQPPFIPPFWLLIAVVSMVALDHVPEQSVLLKPPVSHVGSLMIGIGLCIAIYVDLVFKRRGTTILPFRKANVLVTDGPFQYSRNPIYTGMALALMGFGITLGKPLPLIVVPAFIGIIQFAFIRREEAVLEATFGEDYRQYMQQVRRWI